MTETTLLHPGDPFPALTMALAGGSTLRLPDAVAGHFGVILFFRGSWCPYCNAQLRAFQRCLDSLADLDISVVALSVDDEATTQDLISKHGLEFPVGHRADAGVIAAATGAFVNPDPRYLQSTGFVLDPDGQVIVSVYSSGAIGRLVPQDVMGLVRYLREHAAPGRWRLVSAQGTPVHASRINTGRVPLFCDTALAGRIERAEAQLITQCSEAARRRAGTAGFAIPIAGGVASFAGQGSPYNKVAGLGFGGAPDPAALGEIEKAFADFGSSVQIELAHLADPAIGALLAGRGYRLESFENVLGRALTGEPERVMPPGVEVRPSGEDEFEIWLDVVAEGSVHPDAQGVPWHEEFSREAIIGAERDSAAAGDVRYAALRDGVIVGGATMRMAEGVAQLTGAATAPAHRRRGVQTALLSARLADAAAAGCDVAVITTQPGSKSQQNAQRQGFDLLYTRAVLVRQP